MQRMPRYLTEFIGTFFLVLTIGLTVLAGSIFAPLAIGGSLMIMVYLGGHISGAHYNPAVSTAVLIRGKLPARDLLPYVLVQIAGAIAASIAVWAITGRTFAPAPGPGVMATAALLVEVLYTFSLALVVLNVATATATAGNSFYGLAIGFAIVVGAFAGGPISGGAFNPAVGIGPTIVHAVLGNGTFGHVWLYIVGPLVGAVLAALAFRAQAQA